MEEPSKARRKGVGREVLEPLSPLANQLGAILGGLFCLICLDYFNFSFLPEWLLLICLTGISAGALKWAIGQRNAGLIAHRASLSACILPIWFLTVTVTSWLGWIALSASLAQLGLGLVFVTGLGWTVWLVERASRSLLAKRNLPSHLGGSSAGPLVSMNSQLGQATVRTSNPLDIEAWYYGTKRRKLNQSATTMVLYTICLLYTSPSPRDATLSRMPSSA